jgi:hypothetical protein
MPCLYSSSAILSLLNGSLSSSKDNAKRSKFFGNWKETLILVE